jgi:hypothetical protein
MKNFSVVFYGKNGITKQLGEYLLKGYCMLNDTRQDCNVCEKFLFFEFMVFEVVHSFLRTPEQQLLCVGCNELDAEKTITNKKKRSSEKTKK